MVKYSINKTSHQKDTLNILILPLAVITVFCFAFVLMQPASVKTHRPASRAKTGHATESTGNTHPDDSLTQQFDPLETAPIGPTLNPDTALQTDPPNNGHAAKSQGNGLTNLQGPINSLFNHGPH